MFYGVIYGIFHIGQNSSIMEPTSAGVVMMSGLPIIVGIQLFLNFIAYDMAHNPIKPIHLKL